MRPHGRSVSQLNDSPPEPTEESQQASGQSPRQNSPLSRDNDASLVGNSIGSVASFQITQLLETNLQDEPINTMSLPTNQREILTVGVMDAATTVPMLEISGDDIADTYFNLDALDYSMIDSLFDRQDFDGSITYTSEDWNVDHPSVDFDLSGAPLDFELDIPNYHNASALPVGLDMMQISPLETHRIRILEYLRDTGECNRDQIEWLSPGNMSLFLRSYFAHCHQHTPLLHLPSWNIGTASTRLVFALILMGAMYSGDLKSHGRQSRKLCHIAERYAWSTDPQLNNDGPIMLDTIQAIYLLCLLDTFYFQSSRHNSKIELKRLVIAARSAGLFDRAHYAVDPWAISWTQWSLEQSRLRSVFIFYLAHIN